MTSYVVPKTSFRCWSCGESYSRIVRTDRPAMHFALGGCRQCPATMQSNTQGRFDEILPHLLDGRLTQVEIAERVGCSKRAVERVMAKAKKLGHPVRVAPRPPMGGYQPPAPLRESVMPYLLEGELNYQEIAAETGATWRQVQYYAVHGRRNGLPIPPSPGRRIQTQH